MLPTSLRRSLTGLMVGALTASCGADADAPSDADVAVWALTDEPSLEIGVLDGDPDYVFENIASVLQLPSGNLVVADGGASQLATYAPDGTFLRRWGRRGEGPGEFGNLARAYLRGEDSVMVLDGWTRKVSLFDTLGAFSTQMDATDLSGDSLFAMDVWLYRRFWVDGALSASDRAAVRATLDRIPSGASAPGYRFVLAAENGDLWVRGPRPESDGLRPWMVVDPAGQPKALLSIPDRLTPLSPGPTEFLGRWQGENDVNFVRVYGVAATGATAPHPSWWADEGPASGLDAPTEEEFLREIRATIKAMASQEEIYYSGHGTYTATVDSLDLETPEGLVVDVLTAGTRGWSAVYTHPELDRICALSYGFTIPAGWLPGTVLCSPSTATGTGG